MRNYELIYVLRTTATDEEKEAILNKVKAIIEESAGEVGKVDPWGNKRLAYEIDKVREGYYVLVNFKAETAVPKEIERNLKINDNVMRQIIVNLDED